MRQTTPGVELVHPQAGNDQWLEYRVAGVESQLVTSGNVKYPFHMEPRHIHIRIRSLRRGRQLTQEELAEALGLSRQSINALEAGRTLPSLPVAMQLAEYFAVPVRELFDGFAAAISEGAVAPWAPMPEVLSRLSATYGLPALNVLETDEAIVIELQVPGYQREQLAIDVDDEEVVIAGTIQEAADNRLTLHREFSPRSFERHIPLPVAVRRDRVKATVRDGILTVTLPKLHQSATRVVIE